ncbi:hypothetical protein HDU92_006252 [Lobulomyces angularis]|nr:hypothetical protein HDU92_006252 [Lobulomyces angularis]
MSWKGFTKGLARFPQSIGAGSNSVTIDQEFNHYNEEFNILDKLSVKLYDDSKKLHDSLTAMLKHQASFHATLVDIFSPLNLSKLGSNDSIENFQDESPVSRELEIALNQTKESSQRMDEIKDRLLPELENLERRVVLPTNDLISLLSNVKLKIKKRGNKLLDYDRYRDQVQKLKDRTDRTVSDEKKLGQLETQLDQSTREYFEINSLLLKELPVLLKLRIDFVDPCFRILYWYQLKVYSTLSSAFTEIIKRQFSSSAGAKPIEIYRKNEAAMLEALANLSLNKRPISYNKEPVSLEELKRRKSYEDSRAFQSPTKERLPSFAELHKNTNTFKGSSGVTLNNRSSFEGAKKIEFVVALYDYTSDTKGDLQFSRDDRIEVLERNESGWWKGKFKGEVGMFPGNYVIDI